MLTSFELGNLYACPNYHLLVSHKKCSSVPGAPVPNTLWWTDQLTKRQDVLWIPAGTPWMIVEFKTKIKTNKFGYGRIKVISARNNGVVSGWIDTWLAYSEPLTVGENL